jgi:hypothetical protein
MTSINGQHVALTGAAWLLRRDLLKKILRLGGKSASKGAVTRQTTMLVRGRWAPGEFGTKERRAAELIRNGQEIAVVADSEFRKLLEARKPAKVMDRVAGQPVEWLAQPSRRGFEEVAMVSGPLDYEHSALGRVEQGFLRNNLFGKSDQAVCDLCGRLLPISLMVAAHIKPRSACSSRERRDANNVVFGVCLLGCDALYERGLISVGDSGEIRVAPASGSRALEKLLGIYRRRTCPAWDGSNAKYFKWHFDRRFLG